MSFEPFEARDHHLAGRELVPVLAWGSERRENLDKSRLCGRHSAESRAATTIKSRIAVPACSDALICHAAAMRVAQQVGHCLGQLRRIGGLQGPSLGRPDGGDLGHSRKNPPSRDMYAAIARLYDYLAAAHAEAQPGRDNAIRTLDRILGAPEV